MGAGINVNMLDLVISGEDEESLLLISDTIYLIV